MFSNCILNIPSDVVLSCHMSSLACNVVKPVKRCINENCPLNRLKSSAVAELFHLSVLFNINSGFKLTPGYVTSPFSSGSVGVLPIGTASIDCCFLNNVSRLAVNMFITFSFNC